MIMTTQTRRWSAAFATLTTLAFAWVALATPPTLRPKRKGRSYTVTIGSTPAPATIYLDDKVYGPFGVTPWKGRLVAGSYLLVVEREGLGAVEPDNRGHEQIAHLQRDARARD